MKKLTIDIETRSSIDITLSGLYKYAESSDFDILLFSVSIDDGDVVTLAHYSDWNFFFRHDVP